MRASENAETLKRPIEIKFFIHQSAITGARLAESKICWRILEKFNKLRFKKLNSGDVDHSLQEEDNLFVDIMICIHYKDNWKRKRNKKVMEEELQEEIKKELEKVGCSSYTLRVTLCPR